MDSFGSGNTLQTRSEYRKKTTFRPIIYHSLTESHKYGIIPTAYGEKAWLEEQ